MKMNKKSLFKQFNIGKWWGAFRTLGQYVVWYLSFINFFMILMSWYVLINPEIQRMGILIPLWVFVVLGIVGLIILMLFEHKFTLPSYFTYWNEQMWQHGNPIKKEVEEMRKELKDIKDILEGNRNDRNKI